MDRLDFKQHIGRTLTLGEDVTNPSPDRRKTRDWRCLPVIPAGTRFHVEEFFDVPGAMSIYKAGDYSFKCVVFNPKGEPNTDLGKALLPALIADKRTFGSVAAKYHHSADTAEHIIVQALLKKGELTLDEVDEILAADREEGD